MIWDKCRKCGGTNNDRSASGNDTCFHCGDCGATQCLYESLVLMEVLPDLSVEPKP